MLDVFSLRVSWICRKLNIDIESVAAKHFVCLRTRARRVKYESLRAEITVNVERALYDCTGNTGPPEWLQNV